MSALYRISLLALLFIFFSLTARGQQAYEPGYYVKNGSRTEVLILNRDWRFNPAEIAVRADAESEPSVLSTDALEEFGIDGKARYVHLEVDIEKGATETAFLTDKPEPVRNERVLLRVELAGAASLYSYLSPKVTKYFLAIGDEGPRQLDYQRYLVPGGQVAEVHTYRSQLAERLRCGTEPGEYGSLRYTLREIKQVVQAYNACSNSKETVYENQSSTGKVIHLSVVGGAYITGFQLVYEQGEEQVADLGDRPLPRIGLDLEYTLPFGGNKLALLFRPSYYQYASSGFETYLERDYAVTVDYRAVDLPAAFRYYSFLGKKLRLFGSLGCGYTLMKGDFTRERRELPLLTDMFSLTGEAGLSFLHKWNVSLRYEKNSSAIRNLALSTKTGGFWLSAGYTL